MNGVKMLPTRSSTEYRLTTDLEDEGIWISKHIIRSPNGSAHIMGIIAALLECVDHAQEMELPQSPKVVLKASSTSVLLAFLFVSSSTIHVEWLVERNF